MKKYFKVPLILLTVSVLLGLVIVTDNDQPLTIESLESKTLEGNPVYNQIRFMRLKNKDVWMMNQSHQGPNASSKDWDRLAIVVDRSTSPAQAQFYQLEPGPLEWNENVKPISFRVSCYICHSNGPRMIRPEFTSQFAKLSIRDQIRIQFYNLRIKTYGRVKFDDKLRETQGTPFQWASRYENEMLKVATCTKCHNQSGYFGREPLRRQHALTIQFMINGGHMPPLGRNMSKKDEFDLQNFLNGF